ncbi:MAG: molybdenum cofactor sulfurase [Desulfobacterales bacterium SG8_35_2]|jgi:MOSC domain-containing protein YiiM|nr:MAG: molybdenum cofactor sulfurase [Desulfobacterales bacterium SG8_35_2]
MAYVEAVCLSHKKGIVKKEQDQVVVRENWGIEGDAHAGNWHRQVSLLAGESIDGVKDVLPTLKNGAFAENIITRGIDLSSLRIGDRLQIGDEVILEITQIGKECHNSGCAIKKATGDCIMPREGLFAQVIQSGTIAKQQQIKVVQEPKC